LFLGANVTLFNTNLFNSYYKTSPKFPVNKDGSVKETWDSVIGWFLSPKETCQWLFGVIRRKISAQVIPIPNGIAKNRRDRS
jgi:hypothetical protein